MYQARARISGFEQEQNILVGDSQVVWDGKSYADTAIPWQSPVNGMIYGTIFNVNEQLDAMKETFHEKPYLTKPNRPVLYVKPRNTINAHLHEVVLPEDVSEVQINATLGVVMGENATRLSEENAMEYVGGYTVVNDVTVPHDNFYRPNIKNKVRDGFCPVGPWIMNKDVVSNPEASMIWTFKNDELIQVQNLTDLVRPIKKLLADVTEFMTLYKGDMLLVGVPHNPPIAVNGDTIRIEIDQVGRLENTFVHETGGTAL
ncbi:5-carboxy-2-oxohept-3-enedioate decarboxylase HpaG1 subunit [Oceanobacillus limi]|uniref:5-carboxy-2-oxohept-3-enedioate decarboxylase HpaG1 subunit n=1 Tax=Oceanobacillus limi TaxID=930131 RepID=A0A1I0FRT3_9BACI|nr:fumarylacetoacetate hydrolase family protein [Oceanobacillus limi]SET60065.1 5-carboxy-2-oxohept-3-enedioate decarboxylase HpaG1 subunit [Oceanobacillus limi]